MDTFRTVATKMNAYHCLYCNDVARTSCWVLHYLVVRYRYTGYLETRNLSVQSPFFSEKITCFLSYSFSHLFGTLAFTSHWPTLRLSSWYPLYLGLSDERRSRISLEKTALLSSAFGELFLFESAAQDFWRSLFKSLESSSPDTPGQVKLCISEFKLSLRLNRNAASMLWPRDLGCAPTLFGHAILINVSFATG